MEDILEDGAMDSQMQVIQVPKAKCAVCGYWVPWLKKEPEDCSPSYPGCPIHTYEWEKAFPVDQAADQLISFLGKGDDDSIKEFVEAAPNISDILNAAVGSLMDIAIEEEREETEDVDYVAGIRDDDGPETEESPVTEDDVMVVGKIDPQ